LGAAQRRRGNFRDHLSQFGRAQSAGRRIHRLEWQEDKLSEKSTLVKVGLSGGQTVFEFVKALPEQPRNIILYPTAILGRGDTVLKHVDPIASLMALWVKSGDREDGLFLVTIPPLESKPNGERLSLEDVQHEIDTLVNGRALPESTIRCPRLT
jgi:hypothetical protein